MIKCKHHHSLLFSSWFPYLWKAIFKPVTSYYGQYGQSFYGNEKRGYFCKLDNGITFKIFRHGDAGSNGALYAVYIYHNDKLIINYNTLSDSYVFIVSHNPFSYTESHKINYLIECLKKTLPEDTLKVFDESTTSFENLATFVFRISVNSDMDRQFFQTLTIKYYYEKTNLDKVEYIHLIKQCSEYFSARSKYSFGLTYGIHNEDLAKQHIEKIREMDSYTTSSSYYTLYELSTPKKLNSLDGYRKPIIENSKGFVIESDNDCYVLMFHNSFINRCNYRRGRLHDYKIVSHDNELELTFIKQLKEIMLHLQRKNPSSKFFQHLTDIGIDGVEHIKRKGITDEQWLLYEMMDI